MNECKSKQTLSGNKVEFFISSEDKLNWMPFKGTCLFTDEKSRIPSNGDKPVIFPHDEVEKGMNSMKNMGVDCEWDNFEPAWAFTGHNPRFKVGTVTNVELNGNEMVISGGLWNNDFNDICEMYTNAKNSLGFSVEVYYALEDKGDHYIAHDIEFTGVAVLFRNLAAFDKTYIAAKAKQFGGKTMNEKEVAAMVEKFSAAMNDAVSKVEEKLGAQIKELNDKFEAKEKADKEAAEKAKKQAEELAAKEKAEKERIAAEEAKKQAELAKKKEEEAKAEAKRKSSKFGKIVDRFAEGSKQAEIINNPNLNVHQKFAKLIEEREKAAKEQAE